MKWPINFSTVAKSRLLPFLLVLVLGGGLVEGSRGDPPPKANTDQNLTNQISEVLRQCQKIKPGATRADLLKIFTTEGGVYTARHRAFIYRGCQYVKVLVDFTPTEPNQDVLDQRPTDTIRSISKPYLEWSIID
jgi:hypothetical protein